VHGAGAPPCFLTLRQNWASRAWGFRQSVIHLAAHILAPSRASISQLNFTPVPTGGDAAATIVPPDGPSRARPQPHALATRKFRPARGRFWSRVPSPSPGSVAGSSGTSYLGSGAVRSCCGDIEATRAYPMHTAEELGRSCCRYRDGPSWSERCAMLVTARKTLSA